MNRSIVILMVSTLMACANLNNTSTTNANSSLDQYREARKYSEQKRYEYALQLSKEIGDKIKAESKGKIYFLTSRIFCFPYTDEAMELESKKVESDYQSNIEDKRIDVRNNTYDKVRKINENVEFQQFNRFVIDDVRVNIPYFNISNRGLVLNVGQKIDFNWRGQANIYLIGKIGGKKRMILHWPLSSGNDINKRDFESYLYRQSKTDFDTLGCLAKANPILKYNLSKKDQDAIHKRSYYLGMSSDALMLSQGYPSAVNNTMTSNGNSSQQWVYQDRKKYFYIKSGRINSWQD